MREEPILTDHLVIYYLMSHLEKPILSVSPWEISHHEKGIRERFHKDAHYLFSVLYVKIKNETKWDTDRLQESQLYNWHAGL